MKKSSGKSRVQVLVLYITAGVLIFSCRGNEKRSSASVESKPNYSAPVVFLLDTMPPPKRIELKDVPPPRVIAVPKTPGGSYKGFTGREEENIKLVPPLVTNAPIPLAHFSNFNTQDGLALAGVWCGLTDKQGRLWFGTPGGGVSCYDGTGFINFTSAQGLAYEFVFCMKEDEKGNIWLGTLAGGVSCFDGVRFKNYTTEDGLGDNAIVNIFSDKKGVLWFVTSQHGISFFDGTKFTTIDTSNGLPSNSITGIIEDRKGNKWFTTGGDGIFRYDAGLPILIGTETDGQGNGFTKFTTKDGLPTNDLQCVFEDSKGDLWFGTHENGIVHYDGKTFVTTPTGNNPASNSVRDIAEDKDGNVWFTTQGAGVVRYDGEYFTPFSTEQGLAHNAVLNVTEDKKRNLWFGTMGGGLSRYNGKALTTFTSKQGLPENAVYAIAEDQEGNIWLGTSGSGIIRYDGKDFTSFTTEQGLPGNFSSGIAQDKMGNIWIGTGDGITRFNGKSFTTFTTKQGLASNQVVRVFPDVNEGIWISTSGGLNYFDGREFISFTTEQGLVDNTVWCAAQDKKGILWIGTAGGVSKYDGKRFTNFTTKQGLASNFVNDIKIDKSNNVWVATLGGINRYDGSAFIYFNTGDGLPDDVVYNIAEDGQGVIWVGTNLGILSLKFRIYNRENNFSEIKGAGLFDISNEQLKTHELVLDIYNEKTGYPIKDMVDYQLIIKKKEFPFGTTSDTGLIWGPTGGTELIAFDPKAVFRDSEPPYAFIREIKIDEQSVNWYGLGKIKSDSSLIAQQETMIFGKALSSKVRDSLQKKFSDIRFDSITTFYQVPLNLVLPYNHNRLSIDFGAIETSRNFMVRFQYILEGYDKEWSPITDKTSASYGNISEGAYTFKLRARSPEGVWSETIGYSFKVLPPWWRTWWFRTIIGISFFSLVYGLYRWRTGNLHKQKRILEKTVKERTAEVVKQREKSDELLLNILPSEVADELKEKGYTTAKSFDEVTVLFSDIKGFTNIAENMTAQELVKEINTYFSSFDGIIQQYGLEKIKTIGDAYIAAGGIPEKNAATAINVVEAAIAMQQQVENLKKEREAANKPYFELRIGIHTGPVVAGVVGIKKFQYDIWGDTVNLAARMEQSGVPGKINISQHTYELVKDQFNFVHRGRIDAKNKGEIDMYFVE